MESRFAYEELQVWHKTAEFAILVIDLLDRLDAPRKHYRLIEQLEAACTACGCRRTFARPGRYRPGKDLPFASYLRALCAFAVRFLSNRPLRSRRQERQVSPMLIRVKQVKAEGLEIAAMIKGLINSLRP